MTLVSCKEKEKVFHRIIFRQNRQLFISMGVGSYGLVANRTSQNALFSGSSIYIDFGLQKTK